MHASTPLLLSLPNIRSVLSFRLSLLLLPGPMRPPRLSCMRASLATPTALDFFHPPPVFCA
eukprot:4694020-Pleurochrysis_carterae.AAC.1